MRLEPSTFADLGLFMVTDCTSAAIMQVTSANPDASGSVAHNTGVGIPGNFTRALGRSFTGADLFEIQKSAWYVANSPATGRPSLFRNGEEVVENVERMRVFFGVDADQDRRIDSYVRAGTRRRRHHRNAGVYPLCRRHLQRLRPARLSGIHRHRRSEE